MTGYIIAFMVGLLFGFYVGNKRFRRRISDMIAGFSGRDEDDDYDYEDDED